MSKEALNLVVIGHVDAGKSTLMGHLMVKSGLVDKKVMHKYEQESKKIGKQSFVYAWVMDETGEERSRGVTVDVGASRIETPSKEVTVLDAPGHKDFIPNMIRGAAQADAALLVVDATKGEFETGFQSGGQTREHALLVRSLGISQLIVVVNKMDTCQWSASRYDSIVESTKTFLGTVGFSDIRWIPCSGLEGANLTERSDIASWYNGPCLVEMIDTFKPPSRPTDRPFCLCITDVYKAQTGYLISGRVDAGTVSVGDKVVVLPQDDVATIKGITIEEESKQTARAGDRISVSLQGVEASSLGLGCCLCDPKNPVKVAKKFEARVVVFNVTVPLTKGLPALLHYQSVSEPVTIRKLLNQVHKGTGEVIKEKPRCLPKSSSGNVIIEASRPICLDLFKNVKEMGRFMLRSEGVTLAAGMVTKIHCDAANAT